MKPIYKPKNRAKEYCDYAINIYQGCSHGCTYCYARKMFERYHPNEKFEDVKLRPGIIEATKKQLSSGKFKDKTIQLCFMCDPYPAGIDTTPTREIIKAIKESGSHVQILTKGGNLALRDFGLLDSNDWFGVTLTGAYTTDEPDASTHRERLFGLATARNRGIKTWVSFEPVINDGWVLSCIAAHGEIFDKIKIGKLNYHPSDINWGEFGRRVEALCKARGLNYYIKEDLRKCMEG